MLAKILELKNRVSDKFLRYLVTGVTSLIADYALFTTSYYIFDLSLKISVPLGLIGGLIVNFWMNRYWTFKVTKHTSRHNIGMQFVLYGVLFGFNAVFTYYLIRILLHYDIAAIYGKAVSTVCITLWNYLIYKVAIFKENLEASVIE